MAATDYLVIGAGIVGLTIGRELQRRDPGSTVTIVDKEPRIGLHASGRNSGVLHSGIYYPADTLKARFTRDGNLAWQEYCSDKGIPIDRCGKLIVARNEKEHGQLSVLEERGHENGVIVERVDHKQAQEIEPRVKTYSDALFVPSTAAADPLALLEFQMEDFLQAGGELKLNAPYRQVATTNRVQVGDEWVSAGKVINCAGLQADRVAKDFGFGDKYAILPFIGLYHYASQKARPIASHIYPVPDFANPFLGVHFTRTVDGRTKIGPTAIPALWREQYDGWAGFKLNEITDIALRELSMLATNRNNFRHLAWQEMKKYRLKNMLADASSLLDGVDTMEFNQVGKPGIRAQLVERRSNTLVMDFVIEGDDKSTHVLNSVSPAWTSAIPFAQHVVDFCLQSR